MNETMKESANAESDAVTTKPTWHAPVLQEVDYIKTENGGFTQTYADIALYT